ncbi:phosphatidylserine decarboxylase-domain-containing protein [Pilobolus umbonatus]|nr:phosphatidylserine decarboxylase-domain-containing protein [Pilobolus umbonatus]
MLSSKSKHTEETVSADLVLRVAVIRARCLNKVDETNTPNPYASVRFGGIRQRTDIIKKSAEPEWLCTFDFNLSNDIIGHRRRLRALRKYGLSVSIFGKDRFSAVFLGQVGWTLDKIFEENKPIAFEEMKPKWYPLAVTRQHNRRFKLRKKKDPLDLDSSSSDIEPNQPEICVQYGLLLRDDQGVTLPKSNSLLEDWQYLLSSLHSDDHSQNTLEDDNEEDDQEDDQEIHELEEELKEHADGVPIIQLQKSSSVTTMSKIGRKFKRRQLKKDDSQSSIASSTPSIANSKKERRRRLRRERRKSLKDKYAQLYSDVMGITFLEIESAKDLPPERNMTRTGFDMDPFVIVSYGTSTFRTRAIRHNLNPVWNDKLFFHVKNSEANYKVKFAVYDKDKFSNNDFVASQEITISDIIKKMPHKIPEEGSEPATEEIDENMGRHTIPLILAKSDKWKDSCNPTLTIRAKFVPYVEIRKMFWTALAKTCDADNSNSLNRLEVQSMLEALGSNISESTIDGFWKENGKSANEELTIEELVKSLEAFMQSTDEQQVANKHLKHLKHIKRHEVTIEQDKDLPVDISLSPPKNPFFLASDDDDDDEDSEEDSEDDYFNGIPDYDEDDSVSGTTSTPQSPDEGDYEVLADADGVQYVDAPLKGTELKEEEENETVHHKTQEKVIHLSECPICHKNNLEKRGQMDIVTHVATCAANDWTTVDRFLMGNFGSEAQAQRKWFVKLVNKVGYGKYSAGTNNANIIVQDRKTGQLIDERMSVYIRLGMRLIYKGMKTGIQTKRAQKLLANMSSRQGRRFDNPLSKKEILPFIKFHQLDLSQVLDPIDSFKTFNEFFYRKLIPDARPCDSPDDPTVAVSPADCRMMAFSTIDSATSIWIKGLEFSIAKLLNDPEEASAYEGGSLAIFRLAPQDYHRYHSPVDGVIRKIVSIEGQYYTVNPMAIRTTLDVYGENKRDIVHMESEVFGKVAIACIGAMMVGSIVITANEGDTLSRTDELGYFAFGGSTLVVLFQKDALRFDNDLLDNAANSLETLVQVGNRLGVHP